MTQMNLSMKQKQTDMITDLQLPRGREGRMDRVAI